MLVAGEVHIGISTLHSYPCPVQLERNEICLLYRSICRGVRIHIYRTTSCTTLSSVDKIISIQFKKYPIPAGTLIISC